MFNHSFLFFLKTVQLSLYMETFDEEVLHFRDNISGLEVDSILEFSDEKYAAVEIKLRYNQVESTITNLQNFSKNMLKKPKFMCVIVGVCPRD